MSYSFAPHLAVLLAARSDDATGRLYALIDVAQLPGARRTVERKGPVGTVRNVSFELHLSGGATWSGRVLGRLKLTRYSSAARARRGEVH